MGQGASCGHFQGGTVGAVTRCGIPWALEYLCMLRGLKKTHTNGMEIPSSKSKGWICDENAEGKSFQKYHPKCWLDDDLRWYHP